MQVANPNRAQFSKCAGTAIPYTTIKETWKTPRLATILDFNELERLGMNKANYGQQPCHCRLGESRFHFGFWRTRVYFLEIFTSFNLKMMTSSNKTWLTAF